MSECIIGVFECIIRVMGGSDRNEYFGDGEDDGGDGGWRV